MMSRSGFALFTDSQQVENGADAQSVNICELVLELRKSRMGLVQKMEELRFSWKAVVDAISDDKWVSCARFLVLSF
jgi:protein tyrosine phosphatase